MQEAAHAKESCRRASTRTARLSMTGLAYSLFVRYNLQPVEETGNGWRLHCLWALPGRRPFENHISCLSLQSGLRGQPKNHVIGRTHARTASCSDQQPRHILALWASLSTALCDWLFFAHSVWPAPCPSSPTKSA